MSSIPDTSRDVRRAPAVSPYFRSKLRKPKPSARHVRRARLVDLLDHLGELPVTLVVAPAGSGKTSLVADWLAQAPGPAAWLSVDDADRDIVRFWTGLVSALEECVPGCGAKSLSLLKRTHGVTDAVHCLLAGFADARPGPVRLVVDDLHRIDSTPDVVDSIGTLVEHLPPDLHLVLVSRRVPGLPVERLQASGRLAEVRFPQLRFSQAEAIEMLGRLTPSMAPADVEAAAEHAGGWAAALQLNALAARVVHAQPVATSDRVEQDRLVDDYLWRDVLRAEDPRVIDVLLDIATVVRVNPSLAEALTGRPDALDRLLEAEARGLFVHRLDAAPWFEVHALVRQSLLNELGKRGGDRLLEQHARAARWFEEAGDCTMSIEHWLAADRPRDALRVLAATTTALYDTGRGATIVQVLEQIPLSVATSDLEAMMELAWCHLLVDLDQFVESVKHTAVAAARMEVGPAPGARLRMLEAISSVVTGDWDRGRAQAPEALAALGDAFSTDPVVRFGRDMIARGHALSESWNELGPDIDELRRSSTLDPERHVAFEGTRALGLALAGQPVDALRVAAGVRRTADVGNLTILRAELAIAEAVALRELGDRPRADEALATLATTSAGPVAYSPILARMAVVEQHLGHGDLDPARTRFAELESAVRRQFPGRGAQSWLARVGTRVALADGQVEQARAWAERVDDAFWGPVSLARIDFESGDPESATARLEGAEPRCVRHQVVRDLLLARAAASTAVSDKLVAAAIGTAAAYGLVQTVTDEGLDVLEMVERAAWSAPQEWLDRLRRLATSEAALPRRVSGLVEVLTEREREVLRLLPSRLTLREIADELFVSRNTLKFHLRVIYRKLGVNSRAEAVSAARALRSSPAHGDTFTFAH
ncbi:LuxR C-terminal-related transcriptional regulator [Nocardioides ungokensis]|uniref:LuxR C-terminal-related transcriptional regulator n=1 Tax=Nocardioides ungokensis TaxID=1643322 RepID=UPI0015DE3B6C|nr:LuxR C-terminal-related transcriptional regulator [Nocardioides ungokensis]